MLMTMLPVLYSVILAPVFLSEFCVVFCFEFRGIPCYLAHTEFIKIPLKLKLTISEKIQTPAKLQKPLPWTPYLLPSVAHIPSLTHPPLAHLFTRSVASTTSSLLPSNPCLNHSLPSLTPSARSLMPFLTPFICTKCSRSRRRAEKVDKRM